MDATRRTLPLRRVAMMAALVAVALPAGPAEAAKKKFKAPVITNVTPMDAEVGDVLTLKGRHFRKGKGRNSVGFKRDGAAVVFVKSDISTKRMLKVRVPSRLGEQLLTDGGSPVATRFHLRVLTKRFAKSYTPDKRSPMISPKPAEQGGDGGGTGTPIDFTPDTTPAAPPASAPEADCDGDGTLNGADADDDNDFLSDAFENSIGTDGCKGDSDGDGVSDGYEYRSAIDLNDDEYASPNTALPYPGKRPYPNPLDPKDAGVDHDGDGLTLAEEQGLWRYTTPSPSASPFDDVPGRATPLSYSDGLQHSESVRCSGGAPLTFCGPGDDGRRVPSLPAANYAKWIDFWNWATATGYATVRLNTASDWYDHASRQSVDIRDADLTDGVEPSEEYTLDRDLDGFLADDERDEDADGLSNYDELRSRMRPEYWTGCYGKEPRYYVEYAGTNMVDADSDGDGVRDGADDQDHDDFPNVMELSRFAASSYQYDETDDGIAASVTGGGVHCKPDEDLDDAVKRHATAYGQVNPFNPCLPDTRSRTCADKVVLGGDGWAPFAGPRWWALQ